MLTISIAVMVISSLFIMVDVKRVIDGGETNYIIAALTSTSTCTTCSSRC